MNRAVPPAHGAGLKCSYCNELLVSDFASLSSAQMLRRVAGHVRRHRDRGEDLSDVRANAVIDGVGWSGIVWAVVPPSGLLVNLPTELATSKARAVKQPPGDPATVKGYWVVVEFADGTWSELVVPLDSNLARRIKQGELAALFATSDPGVRTELLTDPHEALLAMVCSASGTRPSRS